MDILTIIGAIFSSIFFSGIIFICIEAFRKSEKEKYSIYISIALITIIILYLLNLQKKEEKKYLELIEMIDNSETIEEVQDYINSQYRPSYDE